jgi:phage terminase large subunit GpA-like protein
MLPPEILAKFPRPHPKLMALFDLLHVKERVPLAQWAEENIVLSPEYSAQTGPLCLCPWQREILNAFSDPSIQEIVIMAGGQSVKTLMIMAAIAYVISEDPGPILLVEPK